MASFSFAQCLHLITSAQLGALCPELGGPPNISAEAWSEWPFGHRTRKPKFCYFHRTKSALCQNFSQISPDAGQPSKNRFKIGIYSKFSSTACSKRKYIYWKPKVFGYPTSRSYSNPPNPTGWRCTLCHPNWCSPPNKISPKGSKIAKFRRTATMPRHLYSGVLN